MMISSYFIICVLNLCLPKSSIDKDDDGSLEKTADHVDKEFLPPWILRKKMYDLPSIIPKSIVEALTRNNEDNLRTYYFRNSRGVRIHCR